MPSSSTSNTSSAAGASAAGVFAIGEVGGDPEAALFALDHELQAFGPAFDHAVERETGGLAAFDRAVEEFAVGGPAGIVDGHGVGGGGFLVALAGLQDFGGEAGCGFLRHRRGRRLTSDGVSGMAVSARAVVERASASPAACGSDGSQGFRDETHGAEARRIGQVCQSRESAGNFQR